MTREFLTFVLAGAIAAGVNWVSNLALHLFMPLQLSVVIAYLIGMTTAYALNRIYVFKASGRTVPEEYGRFAIVNAVALAQVWLVTIGLYELLMPAIGWTLWPAEIAHAIGVASPVITSYFGHRYFTFGPKRPQ